MPSPDIKSLSKDTEYVRGRNLNAEHIELLHRLPSLRRLNLSGHGNYIDDAALEAISKCDKLEELNIEHARAFTPKGFWALAALSQLRILRAGDSKVDDTCLSRVSAFSSLRVLDLSACPGVTDMAVEYIVVGTGIRELVLDGCSNVTDRAATYLQQADSLVLIDLRGTSMSNEVVESLIASNPKLEVIWERHP